MSLTTPDTIRTLQRKLYAKAKQEPAYRFYALYDKVYREDVLQHAYALAKANGGAAGPDRKTFAEIEVSGREAFRRTSSRLRGLRVKNTTKQIVMTWQ